MTRIDGLNPLATSRTIGGQASPGIDAADNDGSSAPVSPGGRQDVLSVSDRGRVVAVGARAVRESSDVRSEKVAALRAAIAEGSYKSNAREIAERLMANGGLGIE
jgi:negative regulator of flagellin synthesis FlgM